MDGKNIPASVLLCASGSARGLEQPLPRAREWIQRSSANPGHPGQALFWEGLHCFLLGRLPPLRRCPVLNDRDGRYQPASIDNLPMAGKPNQTAALGGLNARLAAVGQAQLKRAAQGAFAFNSSDINEIA